MAGIVLANQAAAGIPTPAVGYTTLFVDTSGLGVPRYKFSDGSYAQLASSATNLTAGAGLTGGGDLSASRTFDVGANSDGSIKVNADDIQVGVLATDAQHGNRGGAALHAVVVSGGANGFMSGSDKAKLDTVASNAAVSSVGATSPLGSSGGQNPVISLASAITNAMLASMTAPTLKGRATTGVGAPEDLTPAQVAALLPLATILLQGLMSAADKIRMGQVYDAQADFGFIGDLITTFDGTCSTGAPTKITSAQALFAANAVGNRITLSQAGAGGAQYVGVITNVDSASQVTVSPNISATVSNQGLQWGTDNTTAINLMMTTVNSATFLGAKIVFGQSRTNSYGFPIPVVFNKTVHIEGIGGMYNADNGDYTRAGGTRLCWWGSSMDGGVDFGAFFTVMPATGAAMAVKNFSMRDLWLDGRNGDQNQALIGLRLAGVHGATLEELFFDDFAAIGIHMCSWTGTLSPTADRGVLRPRVSGVHFRQLDNWSGALTAPITATNSIIFTNTAQNLTVSAATMPTLTSYGWVMSNEGTAVLVKYTGGGTTTLSAKCSVYDVVFQYSSIPGSNIVSCTPGNGMCMLLGGDATANTNCGVFMMMQLGHGTLWGPAALELRNADSCEFIGVYINGGNPTNDGLINRIRKEGIRIGGSATSAALVARNHTFRGGDPSSSNGAGASAMGAIYTGARMNYPSGPTYWELYQLGNGARTPNVETGAAFYWDPNGGMPVGGHTALVADQTIAAATLSQINGSVLVLPPQGLQVGTKIRWCIDANKTAAGVATRAVHIRIGTLGTTADAVIATLTHTTVPTAAIDAGVFEVVFTIQSIGASAQSRASLALAAHTGANAGTAAASTGFSTHANDYVQVNGTAFSTVTSNFLYVSLSMLTGAAEVIVVNQVHVEVINPSNP